MSFPGGSDGEESACNVGDLGLIPGSRRPLEKGMATHTVFLPEESHAQRSLAGYSPWRAKSRTQLSDYAHSVCHTSEVLFLDAIIYKVIIHKDPWLQSLAGGS